MAKPTVLPRWAETAGGAPSAEIAEPNGARKDVGFSNVGADIPTGGEFNWLFATILGWCKYLNGLADEAFAWSTRHVFSAGITIPIGQVDEDTAATNRRYVDDAVAAEGAIRLAADDALDVRVTAVEGLDHEGRITTLEGEAAGVSGELVTNPAFNNIIPIGGASALVKTHGVVTMVSGFHNLTIGPGSAKPPGTVLGSVPAGFVRSPAVGFAILGLLFNAGVTTMVRVYIAANGDISVPDVTVEIESILWLNASWHVAP